MRRPGPVFYAFGIYTLAFAVPFLLENASELSEYLPHPLRQGLETIGAKYQRWTNGPRAQQTRYTAVVTLNQQDFPVLLDACKQRALVATLLPQLVQAGADEIVLDLAFGQKTCPETENQATAALKASLIQAATEVPVIVGQASFTAKEEEGPDEKHSARLRAQGLGEDDLVVRPLIDLPLKDPRYQISTGLMKLNEDPRKVPLKWTAYIEGDDKVVRATSGNTLSLMAALAYRAPFPNGTAELEALLSEGRHPFTSLLTKNDFIRVRGADLLCKDQASGAFQACPNGPPSDVRRRLLGKIVLVGWENNPRDLVKPMGNVAGVFVHANYIESLLDSRYLRVIATWLQFLLSAVWFGCIELSFLIYKESIEKALAGAIAVFVVGAFLFYYVAVVNLGFYLALLPPSLVAILLRCWYQWSEGKDEKANSAEPPPQHGNCADEASRELRSTSAPVASG